MNLEQFPTSETAKKMLSYITGNGFYDNSYVGKWIFQVMGEEMGDARAIIDELPLQAFVETATWGLRTMRKSTGCRSGKTFLLMKDGKLSWRREI